ncbi:FecR domain-containing protein [Hydrogenovibrio kuenenii]|uniref:FecR domain-containing protein n=1 Tax=Hydrogenovibrio kuenenii TaxID=63658 RepID=UPI0004664791|nr:FecR domain-containing protein [Hydrogenovibrio kuenenii]
MLRSMIFVLTMLFAIQAFAAIGKVAAVRGDAHFLRDNQLLVMKVGDAVEEKDQIKTGVNTKVQIVFSDRTIVTIGKNTDFSIPQYVYGNAATSKAQFNLAKGVFKSISGKIGKLAPQRFKIKTKTSTIGIRGTTYIVRVIGSETSLATLNGATYMELNSGKTYDVPAGKELVYNVDTGQVTIQNISTTSVSIDSQTSDGKKTETAENGSNDSDEATSTVATTVSSTENTSQNVDTNSVKTDSTTVKVVAGSDTYSSYGYWLNQTTQEKTDPYTEAKTGYAATTPSVLSSVITGQSSLRYAGNLVAISGTSNVSGNVTMDVSYGQISSGNLQFTLNGDAWNFSFSNATINTNQNTDTGYSFSTTSLTDGVTGSDFPDTYSGTVKGRFYGPNAEGVGGIFDVNRTPNSGGTASNAKGSFSAVK